MDNLELCVAFIQKTAIEKALAEIERKLTTEFELRRHARNENRRYCDPKVLTYQVSWKLSPILCSRIQRHNLTTNQRSDSFEYLVFWEFDILLSKSQTKQTERTKISLRNVLFEWLTR